MDRRAGLATVVERALVGSGLEIVEVTSGPGRVRVVLDRPGGVDLDALSEANRLVSAELDLHPEVAPEGRYQLEVTSPGLERPLKTPEHFARAVGREVAIKFSGPDGVRRVSGLLRRADEGKVLIEAEDGEALEVAYESILQARTVFRWGREGSQARPRPRQRRSQRA
jgi:ribosome maturation factor RimP